MGQFAEQKKMEFEFDDYENEIVSRVVDHEFEKEVRRIVAQFVAGEDEDGDSFSTLHQVAESLKRAVIIRTGLRSLFEGSNGDELPETKGDTVPGVYGTATVAMRFSPVNSEVKIVFDNCEDAQCWFKWLEKQIGKAQ